MTLPFSKPTIPLMVCSTNLLFVACRSPSVLIEATVLTLGLQGTDCFHHNAEITMSDTDATTSRETKSCGLIPPTLSLHSEAKAYD